MSLLKWRDIVIRVGGINVTEVVERDGCYIRRHTFDAELTSQQINTLQNEYWYAESGTGYLAGGEPYKWNECIGFERLK